MYLHILSFQPFEIDLEHIPTGKDAYLNNIPKIQTHKHA